MNDFINNLPSIGNMFKLIVFLILAMIIVGLVTKIIATLLPFAILAALAYGVYYLVVRNSEKSKRSL